MIKKIFKKSSTPLLLVLSLGLASCGGLDIDSVSTTSEGTDLRFTRAQLASNVLFSSLILNDSGFGGTRDGFIVLFNTTSDLDEIELRADDDNNALIGNYPWDIDDDDLQVTYPNGVTCFSTQTAETALDITATSRCEGGEPENDRIANTLVSPIFLDDDDISTRSIIINNDDDDVEIDFFANGTFEVTDRDSDGDRIPGTTVVGVYNDSPNFTDVLRLDKSGTGEFSLLILLEGSLETGTIVELRYTNTTGEDILNEVLIYEIEPNDLWEADSVYDDIDIDE